MGSDHQSIRDSLIRSLRAEPLLIDAEESLHSERPADAVAQLRSTLGGLLHAGPGMSEADRIGYGEHNRELIDRFRSAMQRAVRGGANLADAEKEILSELGMHKIGEFRSSLQSHLAGPAEIAEQDLAIYVPGAEGLEEGFRQALAEQLGSAELAAEQESEPDLTPAAEEAALAEAELAQAIATPQAEAPEAMRDVSVRVVRSVGKRLEGLNPLPMLTAALEAIGLDGDEFGFLLRYGRYAPEGRKSEFLVGGLGLAELSNRLTSWLEAQGPLDGQVQVVDEGSGELTIYLLGQEAT